MIGCDSSGSVSACEVFLTNRDLLGHLTILACKVTLQATFKQ